MTYLEIVNQVLRRLREQEVETFAEDEYSLLVGAFVNDAMKFCEDAWNWSGLRQTVIVQTTPDQQNYALTSSDKYDIITNIYNPETQQNLTEIMPARMLDLTRRQSTNTTVSQWAWGKPSGGNATIDFFAIPKTTVNMEVDVIVKTDPLSLETDELNIPFQPVLYLALAYAARERGEVQGQPTSELFALADRYLADAIALDADRFPNEQVWYSV